MALALTKMNQDNTNLEDVIITPQDNFIFNILLYDPHNALSQGTDALKQERARIKIVSSYQEAFNYLKDKNLCDVFLTGINLESQQKAWLRKIHREKPLLPIIQLSNTNSYIEQATFSTNFLEELDDYVIDELGSSDSDLSKFDKEKYDLQVEEYLKKCVQDWKQHRRNIDLKRKPNTLRDITTHIIDRIKEYEERVKGRNLAEATIDPFAQISLTKAFDLTNELYSILSSQSKQKLTRYILSTEGATEGGVGINIDGESPWPFKVLKKLSVARAKQAKIDSDYFNMPENAKLGLRIEVIKPPLYTEDINRAYLWKELIQGVTFNQLLIWINDRNRINNARAEKINNEGTDELAKKGEDLKYKCYKLVENAITTWQEHSPNIPEFRDPEQVIFNYRKNLSNFIESFPEFTDVEISETEKELYVKCVEALPFEKFVTQDTIKRNSAATFRNFMLRISKEGTADKDLKLEDVVAIVTKDGNIDEEKLKKATVIIDTPMKYSFLLEDFFEIVDHYEGGLSKNEKKAKNEREGIIKRAKKERYHYMADIEEKLTEGQRIIKFYRAMRKIFFFAGIYGLRNYEQFELKMCDAQEYENKKQIHKENILHYIGVASNAVAGEIKELKDKYNVKKFELKVDEHEFKSLKQKCSSKELAESYFEELKTREKSISDAKNGKKERLIGIKQILELNYFSMMLRKIRKFNEFTYTKEQAEKYLEYFE